MREQLAPKHSGKRKRHGGRAAETTIAMKIAKNTIYAMFVS
jgi:hypothetical protein